MKKIILSLIAVATLAGCSKGGGGQYIGNWQNAGIKGLSLSITKGSNNDTYFVNIHGREGYHEDGEYSATLNGNQLQATIPLMGAIPLVVDNGNLHFNMGYTCKDCSLYKQIN